MNPQERFVEVAGRRIWTRVAGEGRTVLLCPGAGAPGVGCAPEVEGRIAQFACLATYDRAGLGRSDPSPSPPSVEDMVRDMIGVVDELALPYPMLLIGASLAAFPVQLFACRRPAEVGGLILLDPTPDAMTAEIAGWPEDMQEVTRRNLRGGRNVTPAQAMEMEQMIEGAVTVRDTVVRTGLPDVPLVVAAHDRSNGKSLLQHHQAMAKRTNKGHFVAIPSDGKTDHANALRNDPDLVVTLVKEMLGLS